MTDPTPLNAAELAVVEAFHCGVAFPVSLSHGETSGAAICPECRSLVRFLYGDPKDQIDLIVGGKCNAQTKAVQ